MKDLEKRVAAIESRNAKVELDKAWETSWARRISIGLLTYGVIVIYLIAIGNDKPFIKRGCTGSGLFVLNACASPSPQYLAKSEIMISF